MRLTLDFEGGKCELTILEILSKLSAAYMQTNAYDLLVQVVEQENTRLPVVVSFSAKT